MIPEGMRDVLPGEAAELHAIEAGLRARFAAYGYGEVRTPALEFAETLELADDDTLGGGFRLFDDQGRELMLRTDMTVPVARLAAARYRDRPLPLRFFYAGDSYRPWAPQRSQDGQFRQAGVELLGDASAEADAECVSLVCDALQRGRAARVPRHAQHDGVPGRPRRHARPRRRRQRGAARGARRPRLPAARDDRRQRRGGRRGAQGAAGDARPGRDPRQPGAGTQAGDHAGHGIRDRAPGARARPRRGGRVRRCRDLRLRPLPGSRLLHRRDLRGVGPGRRPAGRLGGPLRRAARALRVGPAGRRFRDRPRPPARRPRRGGPPAGRCRRRRWRSPAASTSPSGSPSCAAPAWPSRRSPATPSRRRRRCAATAAATCSSCPARRGPRARGATSCGR